MAKIILIGRVKNGVQWATKYGNWPDMLRAHAPHLDGFVPGTLNVHPLVPFPPPDDELHCREAHLQGLKSGFDFQKRGNYIHPGIRVRSIRKLNEGVPIPNDVDVNGLVYYPGGLSKAYKYAGRRGTRIEVLSKVRLREALGLAELEQVQVELDVDG